MLQAFGSVILSLYFSAHVFTEWVAKLLEHKNAIGYGGSGFLIAMGVYFFFFKKVVLKTTEGQHSDHLSTGEMFRIFASGFIINTLNPGVIIFWLGNASILALTHTLSERNIDFSPFAC